MPIVIIIIYCILLPLGAIIITPNAINELKVFGKSLKTLLQLIIISSTVWVICGMNTNNTTKHIYKVYNTADNRSQYCRLDNGTIIDVTRIIDK